MTIAIIGLLILLLALVIDEYNEANTHSKRISIWTGFIGFIGLIFMAIGTFLGEV